MVAYFFFFCLLLVSSLGKITKTTKDELMMDFAPQFSLSLLDLASCSFSLSLLVILPVQLISLSILDLHHAFNPQFSSRSPPPSSSPNQSGFLYLSCNFWLLLTKTSFSILLKEREERIRFSNLGETSLPTPIESLLLLLLFFP